MGNSASSKVEKRNNFSDNPIIGILENMKDSVAINLMNVEYVTYLDEKRVQFHFVSGNSIIVLRDTIFTTDTPMKKQIDY